MVGCQLQLETVSSEGCAPEIPVMNLRISARRDAEELLFLSRLAQPGVSRTSQGGLEIKVERKTRAAGRARSRR